MTPNAWLTLESPLDPFRKKVGRTERPCTSLDCINIEKQLGYTYGPGSLQSTKAAVEAAPTRMVTVRGINRARIRGSFLIQVFAHVGGKKHLVGTEGVLSRWHVEGCANCQTHLEARASIPLRGALARRAGSTKFEVEVRTRDGRLEQAPTSSRPAYTVRLE